MYSSTHSLTLALDGGEWSASCPGRLHLQGKSPWYPLDRGFGGPQSRSGRGGEEKNSQPPRRESNPRTPIVQPVAQRYNDWSCVQKFPDWVDNEIYVYNNKHSLRSNTKGYGGKTH
jgi:hypothetical protein